MRWETKPPIGGYTLSMPSSGNVGIVSVLTISLTSSITGSVVITPSASNSDGVFDPTTVTLSDSSPVATVDYTPSIAGSRTISTTNDRGFNDPSPVSFLAISTTYPAIEIGRVYAYPSVSEPVPRFFRGLTDNIPGPYWAEINRDVSNEAVSPYNPAFQALVQSYVTAYGAYDILEFATTSDTSSEYAVGGRAFRDSQESGKPFSVVPGTVIGTSAMRPMTYSGEGADQADQGPVPYDILTPVQGWPLPRGTRWIGAILTYNSPVITGIGDTTGLEVGQTYSVDYQSPTVLYTIQSIDSSTQITLTEPYLPVGPVGEGQIQGPFSRPPNVNEQQSDGHCFCWIRDEATGNPAWLYEEYQIFSPNGDGLTWQASSGCKWNLMTGDQRPNNWGSVNAAGLPTAPLIPSYEECLSGVINHPIRLILGAGIGLSYRSVWPATHGSGAGTENYSPYDQGFVPLGARFRLKQSWLNANLSSLPEIWKPIATALHKYGGIVTDWTPGYTKFQAEFLLDHRWPYDNPLHWTIHLADFELIDTVKPEVTNNCPSTCRVGDSITITASYNVAANTNIPATTIDFWVRDPNGIYTTLLGGALVDTTHRVWTAATWTPTIPGSYYFDFHIWSVSWLYNRNWSVNVLAALPGRAYTWNHSGPGNWSNNAYWTPTPPLPGGPGAYQGDSVTIGNGYTVTIDNQAGISQDGIVKIGDGPPGSNTVTIGGANSILAVGAGNQLWIRGNLLMYGGDTASFLTVGAGGKLIFDPADSLTQLVIGFARYCSSGLRFNGTSGSRCTVGTDFTRAGGSGLNARVNADVDLHGGGVNGIHVAAYTDFFNFGDPITNYGLFTVLDKQDNGTTYDISITNCTFTNCLFSVASTRAGWDSNFVFTNNRFVNSVKTLTDPAVSLYVPQPTTGSRLVQYCSFDRGLSMLGTIDMTVADCVLLEPTGLCGALNTNQYTSWSNADMFARNFICQYSTSATPTLWGPTKDCYMIITNETNPHFLGAGVHSSGASGLNTGWIFEASYFDFLGGDGGDGGDCFMIGQQPFLFAYTFTNCIGVSNVYNGGPGTLLTLWRGTGTTTFAYLHNTWCNSSTPTVDVGEGTISEPLVPGTIAAYKANLDFSFDAVKRKVHASDVWGDSAPGGYTTDVISPSGADYNAGYNVVLSGDHNVNGYHGVFSTSPGTHDLANQDPKFVDSNRTCATWGLTQGADGTLNGAIAKLAANPALIGQATTGLLDWVRAGHAPRNPNLHTTYPTDDSQTDARGADWHTAGQWMGAVKGLLTSFGVTPVTIPTNQVSPLTLTLDGIGTSWASNSVVTIQNSVLGTTTVAKGTWTRTGNESATLTVTSGAGTGICTITIDGMVSQLLTVAPKLINTLPTALPASTSVPIRLEFNGVATQWTSGSTVSVQVVSGSPTVTITSSSWSCYGPTCGVVTVTTGSGTGVVTFTIDGAVSVPIAVAAMSSTLSASSVPSTHKAETIQVSITGVNTQWSPISKVYTLNNLTGTTNFSNGSAIWHSPTLISFHNSATDVGSGTFSVVVDGVVSAPVTQTNP